jgi:predicted transcriptional regulator
MEDIVAAMRSGKISDAELRESLQRHGWHPEFPAIQDEHGVTLVGNRRLRLAAQLAIEPVIKILEIGEGEGPDAERFKLAFISNIGGVPLTARERKAFAIYLKQKRDWSQQRIAEALGVGQASVSRYLEGLSTVDNSKGGRPRKAKGKFRDASVTSESESLMAGAVLDEGKPRAEVAEEFGVSESIVRRSQGSDGRSGDRPVDPVRKRATEIRRVGEAAAGRDREGGRTARRGDGDGAVQ